MKSADWTASITRRELLRRLGAVGLTTAGTAAGLTLLAGCQPSPPAAAPTTASGQAPAAKSGASVAKLTVAGQSLPRTMDPDYDSNLGASLGHRFIFDTLVTAFTGKPEPQLALSWESPNPTTWRFKLRPGVKFHNGEPFNAQSVKFTMDRILDPNGKSVWKARFPTVERVNIVDDLTVDIVSKTPNAALVNVMATIWIQPPNYFQQVGEVKFNESPIGTGPFRLNSWRPDVSMTMEGNKEYWGGAATVGELNLRAIAEPSTRAAAIESGEAQIAVALAPEQADRIKERGLQIQAVNIGQLLVVHFRFHPQADIDAGPIKDKRVRQALAQATDVEGIHKALIAPWARMAQCQIYGADTFGFNPNLKPHPLDLNRAKQLMTEAGYGQGFTVHMDSSSGMFFREKEVTEALINQWAQIGVKLEVDYLETSRWMEKWLATKSGPVILNGWNSAPAFDAEFPLIFGTSGNNRRLMANQDYDELFSKQQQTLDPEERRKLIWQLADLLCQEVLHIPLYEQPSINALAKGLSNAQFNPEWSMYLHKTTMA
ncbi:MAG TPA: ABC transporter substrate-binding protein [Gemmatimonadales bacterium]|nr:ABC transporter substrate-binding protein [Gemmatimonadales bacterium]